MAKYFEDFPIGSEFHSHSTYKIDAEEMKSFERKGISGRITWTRSGQKRH